MHELAFDFTPKPTTQKGRILAALKQAGPRGVCLADLDALHYGDGYAARNRVGDLRKEGKPIEGAPCNLHNHRGGIMRYVLVQP